MDKFYNLISDSLMRITSHSMEGNSNDIKKMSSMKAIKAFSIEPCIIFISSTIGFQLAFFSIGLGIIMGIQNNYGTFSIAWSLIFCSMILSCALYRILIIDKYKNSFDVETSLYTTTVIYDVMQLALTITLIAMLNWNYYMISYILALIFYPIFSLIPLFWHYYIKNKVTKR